MELIMQPTFLTCGQACIAMITGKRIEEVIKDMKTDGATSIGQLIAILDVYGIRHAEKNKRISKKNPGQNWNMKLVISNHWLQQRIIFYRNMVKISMN